MGLLLVVRLYISCEGLGFGLVVRLYIGFSLVEWFFLIDSVEIRLCVTDCDLG